MKPKIESAVEFIARGGREVVITNINDLISALRGESGTHVVP
jgi:carbamate kinase